MKTREQIYGQEATSILRDITMYRALTEEQLLRLYPGKRGKVQNLLSYLTKQGRIWHIDGLYCAAPECAGMWTRGCWPQFGCWRTSLTGRSSTPWAISLPS